MKAILVVDEMPKNCYHCPLHDYEHLWCYGRNDSSVSMEEDIESKRNDNCPLKPLPHKNKYDVEKYGTVDYENNITLGHYLNKGWNDCIDAILGEEDE